jgi:hypothetical protein
MFNITQKVETKMIIFQNETIPGLTKYVGVDCGASKSAAKCFQNINEIL